jgi:ribosomal-protein-alanine N-acetyltransferase
VSDLFPPELRTERLRLEAVTADTDPLEVYEHAREGAPDIDVVTEHLGWQPHASPRETVAFLSAVADERAAGDGASYVIRPREGEDGAGVFAGLCGIEVDWDRRLADLGIWLRRRFWGRGYSGERAGALLELAFDRLDLEVVEVYHYEGNDRSRRAIEKYVDRFGGRHEGLLRNARATQGDGPRDAHRYTISRSEFEAARDGA